MFNVFFVVIVIVKMPPVYLVAQQGGIYIKVLTGSTNMPLNTTFIFKPSGCQASKYDAGDKKLCYK